MKIEVGRDQLLQQAGPYAQRLSQATAQHISQIMQYAGISGIYLEPVRTFYGVSLRLGRVATFDGVPAQAAFYASSVAQGLAGLMAAVGITRISFQLETPEDLAGLVSVWSELAAPAPAAKEEAAVNAEATTEEAPVTPEAPAADAAEAKIEV